MYRRVLFALFILSLVSWGSGAPGFQANAPLLEQPDAAPGGKLSPSASLAAQRFWHSQTFGDADHPYLADVSHLYLPTGIGLDDAGNLWIWERLRG